MEAFQPQRVGERLYIRGPTSEMTRNAWRREPVTWPLWSDGENARVACRCVEASRIEPRARAAVKEDDRNTGGLSPGCVAKGATIW